MSVMTAILARRPPPTGLRDWLRLLAAVALLIVASVAWHAARPHVLRACARSSFGLYTRTSLLHAVVSDLHPELPLVNKSSYSPLSFRGPGGAYLVADANPSGADPRNPGASPDWHVFFDGAFDVRGSLRILGQAWLAPPGDWDNDGRVETTVWCLQQYPYSLIAVVRLGPTENEVAALIRLDLQALIRASGPQIRPQWQSSDPSALPDLVFLLWPRKSPPTPWPFPFFGPPQTIAVLRWDKPARVLVPVQFPGDGSLVVWTPPDGQPYRFGRDQNANDVFNMLLPPPPATQPAPAPATSPTSQ